MRNCHDYARVFFALFLMVIVCAVDGAGAVELLDANGKLKKTVWAHHTPWHNPLNNAFTIDKYYSYPLQRSSGDQTADYRSEFMQAKKQGIDGFFVDVVGKNKGATHYFAEIIKMLKAAKGMDFWVAPCIDRSIDVDWQVHELVRLFKECGDSPNYPKVGGKYVVATYSWYGHSPQNWKAIKDKMAKAGYPIFLIGNFGKGFKKVTPQHLDDYKDVYDLSYMFGYVTLSGYTPEQTYTILRDAAKRHGKEWMGTYWPGYCGAWLNGRNDFYQPHLGFDQILDSASVLDKMQPSWLHLTTWNDHDETSLMPMRFEFGGNEQINRYLIDRWHGRALPGENKLFFAYHREEIIGTVLRIETLLLPSTAGGKVKVWGYLADEKGKKVYELNKQEYDAGTKELFLRNEWCVPTAEFAGALSVSPVITVEQGGKRVEKSLPPVMMVAGWLQNQTTVKVPFTDIAEARSTLSVSQSGNELVAALEFSSDEEIVRAELFRNDRPIGPLSLSPSKEPLLFTSAAYVRRCSFALNVYNGEIEQAERKFTEKSANSFGWCKKYLVALNNARWNYVALQAAVNVTGGVMVKVNRNKAQKISLDALLSNKVLFLGGKKKSLVFKAQDIDNFVNTRADFAPLKSGSLKLRLWSRAKLDNDKFYAMLETKSGKTILTPVVAPFTTGKKIPLRVVQTMVNLETSSEFTGVDGVSGFLGNAPFVKPQVREVMASAANMRRGWWDFEGEGWDSLGDMPLKTAKKAYWYDSAKYLVDEGYDGGKCLKLDGKSALKMRARVWPMGACTIEFWLKPDDLNLAKKAPILTRSGWSSAFLIYMLPGGKLEVTRSEGERKVVGISMVSAAALEAGQWTKVRVVYDGKVAKLYFNDKLEASKKMPLNIKYGNCTPIIGGKDGYKGLLDDLSIYSYGATEGGVEPEEKYGKLENVELSVVGNDEMIFDLSQIKGKKMKNSKIATLLGTFAAMVYANAAPPAKAAKPAKPTKAVTGELVTKVGVPPKNSTVKVVEGTPSMDALDNELSKGLLTAGKDGAFTLSVGQKRKTSVINFPLKIAEGEELVVKIRGLKTSAEPKGWIAVAIGVQDEAKKQDLGGFFSMDRFYVAKRLPKFQSLGATVNNLKYPLTLQIRRLDGKLVFLINGSPRISYKEQGAAVDRPYVYITSQKIKSTVVLDIESVQLHKINKESVAKEPKPARSL